jgi:hypothetical protein
MGFLQLPQFFQTSFISTPFAVAENYHGRSTSVVI